MLINRVQVACVVLAVASFFFGCATPGSGIVEIAPDTYMHSSFGSFVTFSGSEVKAQLYREANAFCAGKGKQLVPLDSTAQDSGLGTYASAEIQFRCK